MNRNILIGLGMIGATALLILAGSARAEPPPSGSFVSFHQIMIVCDKSDSLKELVAAQKISKDAFGEKAKELISDKHVCTAAHLLNVAVGKSEDMELVKWDDAEEHLWVMHIGTSKSDFYALYEEVLTKGPEAGSPESPKSEDRLYRPL